MSLDPLDDTQLAAVVTYLEMTERPKAIPLAHPELRLERRRCISAADYRALFLAVGGPWLWFSRLLLDEDALLAIVQEPQVDVLAVVTEAGEEVGMLELDFRQPGECELAFVGLIPALSAKGHGRWLLSEAVDRAWRAGVIRVHVHTCTLDHPAALAAYRRAGFKPYRRAVERFADPRLAGILPMDCAPQAAVLGTPACAARCP